AGPEKPLLLRPDRLERIEPETGDRPPGDGPGQRAGHGAGRAGSEDDDRRPAAAIDRGRGTERESDRDAGDEDGTPPVDHDGDSPRGASDEVEKRLVHREWKTMSAGRAATTGKTRPG